MANEADEENIVKVFVSGGNTQVVHFRDSDHLYACSNGIVKIFDQNRPDLEPEVMDIAGGMRSFEVGPAGRALVASQSGECKMYDLKAQKETATLQRSPLGMTSAVFTHSGTMALCGGLEGKLWLVDVQGEEHQVKNTTSAGDQIFGISYNNVGDLAAISLANGDLAVYSYTAVEPRLVHTFSTLLVAKKALGGGQNGEKAAGELFGEGGEEDAFDDDLEADILQAKDGKVPQEAEMEGLATVRPDWHPDGDLLAIPTRTREIAVFDRADFSRPAFKFPARNAHRGPVVDVRWSPDGKLLASVGLDKRLKVWNLEKKRQVMARELPMLPSSLTWGRSSAEVVVGMMSGNVAWYSVGDNAGMVLSEAEEEEEGEDELHGEEGEGEGEGEEGDEEGGKDEAAEYGKDTKIADFTKDTPPDTKSTTKESKNAEEASENEGGLFGDSEDDFIVDDDGAGYTEGRRGVEEVGSGKTRPAKRRKLQGEHGGSLQALAGIPGPYSPGCTPWASGRRYMTMNPVGYAWSVSQDGYNTVTVTFFDRSMQKEYHFRDFDGLDVASMDADGILLASSGVGEHQGGQKRPRGKVEACILYKKHDQSRGWRRKVGLQPGEFITAVSLGPSAAFVCTSRGYVRRYSLFGRLERLEKLPPVLACISSSKYLFTVIYNSPYSLGFNLQSLDGRYLQRNESLPVCGAGLAPQMHPIRGLFFSSDGDPCVVGQDNVVLVLSRWRDPLQACWMPVLDAKAGLARISAGSGVSAWPLGLFGDKFCFVAIRSSRYPTFPLALPSEMPVRVPVGEGDGEEDSEDENSKDNSKDNGKDNGKNDNSPEEELMRTIVQAELLNDAISNDDVEDETAEERLAALSVRYDAALLRQVGQSCNRGDILDAFYLVTKLRDDRALAAAAKMAERLELAGLVDKINRLRETRMQIEGE